MISYKDASSQVLRCSLSKGHREVVLKCEVPNTAMLIMNKHSFFSSLSISVGPGLMGSFQVNIATWHRCTAFA